MLLTTCGFALFGGLLSVAHSSPIARDNDGARPISWQDPSGQYFCWAVEGELTAGAPIGIATCDNSQAQSFIYTNNATSIQVSGTDPSLCVEFGPGLGRNGTPLRVQNCRPNGAPGQRLFINDNHVSLQNGPGQCADIFTFGAPPVPPVPIARILTNPVRTGECMRAETLDPKALNLIQSSGECDPSPANQFYFDLGTAPELRDSDGNVYNVQVRRGVEGVRTGTFAPPDGQRVTVEAGIGKFAGRVKVAIKGYPGDEDTLRCVTAYPNFQAIEWVECDIDGIQEQQYWIVNPPL